jgi:hypothetical protein
MIKDPSIGHIGHRRVPTTLAQSIGLLNLQTVDLSAGVVEIRHWEMIISDY